MFQFDLICPRYMIINKYNIGYVYCQYVLFSDLSRVVGVSKLLSIAVKVLLSLVVVLVVTVVSR